VVGAERALGPRIEACQIARMGGSAEQLLSTLGDFRLADDIEELIRIIRRPGWTTPAELLFSDAILGHMRTQLEGLQILGSELLKGAGAVSIES
jgi:hypothetical protein